jgi:hypothetical protein
MTDQDIRQRLEDLHAERERLRYQQRINSKELEAAVIAAHHRGMSELELSRVAGVARMTVRKWLGK